MTIAELILFAVGILVAYLFGRKGRPAAPITPRRPGEYRDEPIGGLADTIGQRPAGSADAPAVRLGARPRRDAGDTRTYRPVGSHDRAGFAARDDEGTGGDAGGSGGHMDGVPLPAEPVADLDGGADGGDSIRGG